MTSVEPVVVAIPTRDRPDLLAGALRSVLAQTDGDLLVVVADDGDGEPVEDDPRLPKDARISFVRSSARCAGGARNAAILHAEARRLGRAATLVALLDDDDLWHPTHLAVCRAALARAPDATFVHGGAVTVDEHGEASDYHARDAGPLDGRIFRALLRRSFVATSSVVLRAAAWRAVGGFRADSRHGDDLALWLELSFAGPVAYAPETTVTYRAHGANMSRGLVRKAADHADAVAQWWPRRHRLEPADRRALRRELARRHRRHLRRLSRERSIPRRALRALARTRFAEVPHPVTLRALVEATLGL